MLKFLASIALTVVIATSAVANHYHTEETVSFDTRQEAIDFINKSLDNWTPFDIGAFAFRHILAYPDWHNSYSTTVGDGPQGNYRVDVMKSETVVESGFTCSTIDFWISHVGSLYDGRENHFATRLCFTTQTIEFRGMYIEIQINEPEA